LGGVTFKYMSSWFKNLESKWNVSGKQLIIILIVFSLTGTTILLLKRPIVAYFAPNGEKSVLFTIIYLILILPIYNVFLLIYGFLLGQGKFFWEYEKKFFKRIFRKGIKSQ